MTTEDDFQAMLAARPDDHATRLILADFLDECGDPRGPGYRALAILRRIPVQPDRPSRFIYPGYCSTRGARSVDGSGDSREEAALAVLPKDWLAATQNHLGAADPLQDDRWACADTRRAAEDAAATAFAKLPLTRRTKLLAPSAHRARTARPKPTPLPGSAWTAAEVALLGKLSDADVVARTGRTLAAVRSKRRRNAGG